MILKLFAVLDRRSFRKSQSV